MGIEIETLPIVDKENRSYLQLHLAVFLFGFTAILGNLINLSAVMIVWWRVVITSLSLLFFINWRREVMTLSTGQIIKFLGIGMIIAVHWICFYGAIKLANSSIALITAATVAFFTSLIEPLLNKRRVDSLEIISGILIIPGMYIIVQNVDTSFAYGIYAGLVAALLAALFSILNKRYISEASPYVINFLEMVGAVFLVSLVILFAKEYIDIGKITPSTWHDVGYLLVLALVCTTFTNVLALKALKNLTAFASNLVFNFEPLYGILLAALLLKEYEQLTLGFYIGGGIIISIVLLYPWIQSKRK